MKKLVFPLGLVAAAFVLAASASAGARDATHANRAKNGEIAFSAIVHGIPQVFTVEPNGNGLRQVTRSVTGAGQNGISWSPDGSDLLYSVTGSDGIDRIVRSSIDGNTAVPISPPCIAPCLGDDDPVYSPNAKKIAFERAFGPVVNGDASVVAIFTMNADGSDPRQLTQHTLPTSSEDVEPRWSPNGMKIAFYRFNTTAAPRNKGAIEVMNADGSNLRRLTPYRLDAGNPRWSPNGILLLFNTYANAAQGRSANLFTMRTGGSHRVALTHFSGGSLQAFAADWSPDGKYILYARLVYSGTDTSTGAYYIVDNHGHHKRRLGSIRITADSRAAWGTQGSARILAQARVHGSGAG